MSFKEYLSGFFYSYSRPLIIAVLGGVFTFGLIRGCSNKAADPHERQTISGYEECKEKRANAQRIEELERKLEAARKPELEVEKVEIKDINNDGLPDVIIKFYNDYLSVHYLNDGNGQTTKSKESGRRN